MMTMVENSDDTSSNTLKDRDCQSVEMTRCSNTITLIDHQSAVSWPCYRCRFVITMYF